MPVLGVCGGEERLSTVIAGAADLCEQGTGECDVRRAAEQRPAGSKKRGRRRRQAGMTGEG